MHRFVYTLNIYVNESRLNVNDIDLALNIINKFNIINYCTQILLCSFKSIRKTLNYFSVTKFLKTQSDKFVNTFEHFQNIFLIFHKKIDQLISYPLSQILNVYSHFTKTSVHTCSN